MASPVEEPRWHGLPRPKFLSMTVPWSDAMAKAFEASSVRGLDISRITDISFLPELRGLRALRVWAPVRDDTPVARCDDLEFLDLNSKAKGHIDLSRLEKLRDLTVASRPGQESLAGLSLLETIFVDGPIRHADAFAGKPLLKSITCGMAPYAALRRLARETTEMRVLQLSTDKAEILGDFSALSHLQALLVSFVDQGVDVDLSPLAQCAQLRAVVIVNEKGRVRGVDRLNDLPFLTRLETSDLLGCRKYRRSPGVGVWA